MDLTEVQALADAALRIYRDGGDGAGEARDAAIAAAREYAGSDDTVVATNSWPHVTLQGKRVAERGKLLLAIGSLFPDARFGLASASAMPQTGRTEHYRPNGGQTSIEAALVVFYMLQTVLLDVIGAEAAAEWVDGVITDMGATVQPPLDARMLLDEYETDPEPVSIAEVGAAIREGRTADNPLPAAAALITYAWITFEDNSPQKAAVAKIDGVLNDHSVTRANARQVTGAVDAEAQRWLEDMQSPPPPTTIADLATTLAVTIAPGPFRQTAVTVAGLELWAPDRGKALQTNPVGAAIGAAARAAVIVTHTTVPTGSMMELAKRAEASDQEELPESPGSPELLVDIERDDSDRPLEMGEGVDVGSPLAWRAESTALLIQMAALEYTRDSPQDLDYERHVALDDYDVNTGNANEVVIWSDVVIEEWLKKEPSAAVPSQDAWADRAEAIASFLAAGFDTEAAVAFARLPFGAPGRNAAARTDPMATALGAAARAAALATLLPKMHRLLLDMVKLLNPDAMQGVNLGNPQADHKARQQAKQKAKRRAKRKNKK